MQFVVRTVAPEENCTPPRPRIGLGFGIGLSLGVGTIFLRGNFHRTMEIT